MKKYLYIALAAAALTSCSSEEVMETVEKQAIAFGNPFIENSTRAAVDPSFSNTDNKLTSFNVWGTVDDTQGNPVAIFANDLVNGEVGVGSVWTCTKTQYWIEGSKYNFAAVVNGNVTELGDDKLPKTITYTADGTTDLLYDKSDEDIVGKPAKDPEFIFEHLLSKVKFTVENSTTDASNYKHVITGIKIANAYATGSYDVPTKKWTGTSGGNGQSFDDITATAASTECANEKLLIPGLTEVKVEFTVNLYYNNGTTETLMSTTPYTGANAKTATITGGLLAANAYNFKITVGMGSKIQFTVEKTPTWTNAPDQPITVQ